MYRNLVIRKVNSFGFFAWILSQLNLLYKNFKIHNSVKFHTPKKGEGGLVGRWEQKDVRIVQRLFKDWHWYMLSSQERPFAPTCHFPVLGSCTTLPQQSATYSRFICMTNQFLCSSPYHPYCGQGSIATSSCSSNKLPAWWYLLCVVQTSNQQ